MTASGGSPLDSESSLQSLTRLSANALCIAKRRFALAIGFVMSLPFRWNIGNEFGMNAERIIEYRKRWLALVLLENWRFPIGSKENFPCRFVEPGLQVKPGSFFSGGLTVITARVSALCLKF